MISFHDLTFTYPGAKVSALQGINAQIPAGELCLVMGSSGSGKSTLLRCINGLVPHFSGGKLQGSILVNGLDPVSLSPSEMSQTVGFVFQDPEAQFVVDIVEDEIAFSLENAAIPPDEMEVRIGEALQMLELTNLRSRRLETLSGGERQRVVIAAALALKPRILVLDEPTSQLDPLSADAVLQILMNLKKRTGLTIVLAEHRLERVLPYAGQIIYLSNNFTGGLSGNPRDVLCQVPLVPPLISLAKAKKWEPLPLTVSEAQEFIRQSPDTIPSVSREANTSQITTARKEQKSFMKVEDVHVSYGNTHALQGVTLSLYPGEITVMMGPNGAGKTTLLRSMIGLTPIEDGSIHLEGKDIRGRSVADICQRVGYLPQDPNALLFADTVLDELLITLQNHAMNIDSFQSSTDLLLERLGLTGKMNDYPRDLSTGERQRVAMGAVMVTHPGGLILDEPTRGLDYQAKQDLLDLLHTWRDDGMMVLMVTHDVELAAQAADRIIILEDGLVTADGFPQEVLTHFTAFSPQVAKIYPGRGWLTVEDAIGGVDANEH